MTMTSSDDDDNDDDDDEWHYKLNHYGMAFTSSMRRDIWVRHYETLCPYTTDWWWRQQWWWWWCSLWYVNDDDGGGGGGCDDNNDDNDVNDNEWWFWWWWWVALLIKSLWDGIHLFYDMRHVSEEPCQQCPVTWRQLSKELFSFFHLFTSVLDTYSKTIMRRTATTAT